MPNYNPGKLVKTTGAVGKHLGISEGRVRQLKRKTTLSMCQQANGMWDLEKVTAWDALRKELGHPPDEEEMAAGNLEIREVTVAEDRTEVERYRLNRVEVLAKGQVKRQNLALRIIDDLHRSMDGAEGTKKLTNHEKVNALRALDGGFGILYDKERLEMGESTENVAVIVGAIKDLKRKREREYGLGG